MSYCPNPNCLSPQNPNTITICQSCNTRLLLNERYRALKPIGRGGFGKTFLAEDIYKPSIPYCVIKQFHGKGFDDAVKAKELFDREAELQDKLGQHLHIPELLAFLPQDGYLYLVQEFIDGCDLNQELKKESTFSEAKIWQLMKDLLPVIQFVHENNVIHRDIKPENIIRHCADNRLFLVDFGIAKLTTETIETKTGTVIGTPGYTAPEQHEGKPIFASDLYGLGATCYRLLTLADPSKLLYSWVVDWQKELRDNLEKRYISDELIRIVTKLLQPDISQRYQSAKEVIQDLHLEQNEINNESPIIFSVPISKPLPETWRCVNTLTGHHWDVLTIAISPNSQTLASGSTDHTIKIWNLDTGNLCDTRSNYINQQRTADIYSLAFSPDGETLVSAGWGSPNDAKKNIIQHTIQLWELSKMERLRTFTGHLSWVGSIAISPRGKIIASGSGDKTIKLWNLHTGEMLKSLDGHSMKVNSVALNPKNKILASGSDDNTIKIWDVTTGALLNTFTEHLEPINSIAFCPKGQFLASGSDDNTIKIWDITTGKLLKSFTENSSVNSVNFNPEGQILASGSNDATIKLWDFGTGELLNTLTEHTESVYSVSFSPDGQILASGSGDKTIKIWRRDYYY